MTSSITIPFGDSQIRGTKEISWRGKNYYSFLGIPYAEPPIGDLRFSPPKLLENYPNHIDATEFKSSCIQHSPNPDETTVGSEDCLHLNIFNPKLPSPDTLLPVAFYIHGGSHILFSSKELMPHLLIENDFIVVTFNYRLHVFGFLNLGLPACPGNVGLKDQLCALQWVKKNIKYFGGNPENITLMGMSSGASSAHMMIMSPLFKNLSNKVILCGGDALSPWNFNPSPLKLAFELGRKFGYKGTDKETLLNLLKAAPADKLTEAVKTIFRENLETPCSSSFLPSIELIKEGAFLPDSPKNLWKNVDSVSIIYGINKNEGIYFFRLPDFQRMISQHEKLKLVIADITCVRREFLDNMFEEIISFYEITGEDDEKNSKAEQNLFTDLVLKNYYTTFDRFHKSSNLHSVFNYKFMYCGENNFMSKRWGPRLKRIFEGTCHGDEYGYLFLQGDHNSPEKEIKVAQNLCTLLGNFIKYGNPNGENFDGLWLPSTKKAPSYLHIGEVLSTRNEYLNSEQAKFWKYLASKYFL